MDGSVLQICMLSQWVGFLSAKFTKPLKPVYPTLRQSGHLSSSYIDDSILQDDDCNDSVTNVITTLKLFDSLGIVIHPLKMSVLVPSQRITYLGFALDSIEMKIYLTLCKGQFPIPSASIGKIHSSSLTFIRITLQ